MAYESYSKRLARINKLTKRMAELEVSPEELSVASGVSADRILEIQQGYAIKRWEGQRLCESLESPWTDLWVLFEGDWVVRERLR